MFVLHRPLSPGSPPAPDLHFYQVKIRTHSQRETPGSLFYAKQPLTAGTLKAETVKGNVASKHRVQQNH